jgi:cell wall assembly regulator SMI1
VEAGGIAGVIYYLPGGLDNHRSMTTYRLGTDHRELPRMLDRLDWLWRGVQHPALNRLRPGLSLGQIDQLAAAAGVRVSDEARVWWMWHDGVDGAAKVRDPQTLVPGWTLLSLSDAIRLRDNRRALIAEWGADADREWPLPWIPLANDVGGQIITCDCSGPAEHDAPIHVVDFHDESFEEAHVASLSDMVSLWLRAFDEGWWAWTGTDWKLPEPGDVPLDIDLSRVVV